MGIFFPLNILKFSFISLSICRNIKLLQVVNMDGKVIEFTSPLLVKDLLVDFEGIDVRSSRKASYSLPTNFELKLGKIYHLHPSKVVCEAKKMETPSKGEAKTNMSVSRIKVVITKKQLQELLNKETTIEQICGIDETSFVDSPSQWKPGLASIPEEEEEATSYELKRLVAI